MDHKTNWGYKTDYSDPLKTRKKWLISALENDTTLDQTIKKLYPNEYSKKSLPREKIVEMVKNTLKELTLSETWNDSNYK